MNKLVIGLFLGTITALRLNQALPDYWDGNYSNTWKYTDHTHLVNETAWLEGNPYGYTQAVFGDNAKGGKRSDGYPALQTGAKTLMMMGEDMQTPDVPDNYNRENAWTDRQHDNSHYKEFHDETKKITQGGYNVAAQRQGLAQKDVISIQRDEAEFQAQKHYS